MAVAFVGASSNEGTDNTLEATMPGAMDDGDVAFIVYQNDLGGHNHSGHAPADADYFPADPVFGDINDGSPDYIWTMVYQASGTPATQTHTINTSDEWLTGVAAYSGVDYDQLITDDTDAFASNVSSGDVTDHVLPALTPPHDNSMVVYGVAFDTSTASRTFSTDSDGGGTHTLRLTAEDTSVGLKIAIFDVLQGTAAEIQPTVSFTGGSDQVTGFIIALPPEASAGDAGGPLRRPHARFGALLQM